MRHSTIGVDLIASRDEIDEAYRRLAARHPSRNTEPSAEARLKAVNEAHEILFDAKRRSDYEFEAWTVA